MVVWMFVALIITQTYTANLASMLTVEKLEPTVDNVDQLRESNAIVGCGRGSFMKNYLHDVLHFHPTNIRRFYSAEDYAEALRSKQIAAAFLEVPGAKLFLAKYCKEFIQAGPKYKIGGFAFVMLLHFLLRDYVFVCLFIRKFRLSQTTSRYIGMSGTLFNKSRLRHVLCLFMINFTGISKEITIASYCEQSPDAGN